MKTIILTMALLTMNISVSLSQTGCIYNGRAYPPGTKIGPYTCQPDGTWR